MLLEGVGDLSRLRAGSGWIAHSQCQPSPFFPTAQDIAAGWICDAELIASAGLVPDEAGEMSREQEDAFPPGNPASRVILKVQNRKCNRRTHGWWKSQQHRRSL